MTTDTCQYTGVATTLQNGLSPIERNWRTMRVQFPNIKVIQLCHLISGAARATQLTQDDVTVARARNPGNCWRDQSNGYLIILRT